MKLLKDTMISTASAGIGAVLSALQAIVVARLLGPTGYGVLQVYRLCLTYTSFSNLGSFWAMVREIAHNRGAGNEKIAFDVKNVTFTINLILSTITLFIIFLYLYFSDRISGLETADILIFFFIIILSNIYLFGKNYFVAVDNFIDRSKLLLVFPAGNLLLVFLLTPAFGVTGVLTAMLIAYSISLFYVFFRKKITVRLYLQKDTLFQLVKTGLPICGNGLLVTIMNNIDRMIIMFYFPIAQLGFYGISATIKVFLENLYRTVFISVFPKISECYGKTESVDSIRRYVWVPILVSTYLSPFFFGTAIIMISPMIKYILPQYIPAILPSQLIIASAYFGCIQVGIMNMVITINRVSGIYVFRILTILLTIGCSLVMIKLDFGIMGVAFAVLISSGFLSVLLVNFFLSFYQLSLKERFFHFIDIGLPFLVMSAGVLAGYYLINSPASGFKGEIETMIYREVIFIAFNIPLFLVIQKKTQVISKLWYIYL